MQRRTLATLILHRDRRQRRTRTSTRFLTSIARCIAARRPAAIQTVFHFQALQRNRVPNRLRIAWRRGSRPFHKGAATLASGRRSDHPGKGQIGTWQKPAKLQRNAGYDRFFPTRKSSRSFTRTLEWVCSRPFPPLACTWPSAASSRPCFDVVRALSTYFDWDGDSGEAEHSFRMEAERHSGMIPNTIGA